MKFKKNIVFLMMAIFIVGSFAFSFAAAQVTKGQSGEQNGQTGVGNQGGGERVGSVQPTVCCEKTLKGLFCTNAPETECDTSNGLRKLQTSCSSSSFCRPGFCFDPVEGTCLDNVAQVVCNNKGGTWNPTKPIQCNLGCCVLGDQGSFVTLTRCQKLSSYYGLNTSFNPNIQNAQECVNIASSKEKGACVYIKNGFQRSCKFTSRADCTADSIYSGASSAAPAKQTTPSDIVQKSGTGNTAPATTPATGTNTPASGSPATGKAVSGSETNSPDSVKDGEVKFYGGKLCSAAELKTECGPTKQTTCADGKEEVYFLDTCGNVANIYDASKTHDSDYWSNIKDKSESCSASGNNQDSQTCGNCNYLLGSYCREAKDVRPTYGNYICENLNCIDSDGKKRLHGESWCGFDTQKDFSPVKMDSNFVTRAIEQTFTQALANVKAGKFIGTAFLTANTVPVGSKFYRYQCNNGKVIVEPCADFRQEECIQDSISTPHGEFSQAACRVNRWQDCTTQKSQTNCENSDKRDCKWIPGLQYVLMATVVNGSTLDQSSFPQLKQAVRDAGGIKNLPTGACVPKTAPGLNFYDNAQEAQGVCSQANAICLVTYEKGLTGGGLKCVKNCECLQPEVQLARAQLCTSLGDCGPKVNIVNEPGNTKGYTVITENLKKNKK